MIITNTHTGEVFELDEPQLLAVDHLYYNPRAALFLEMSLSKTISTLLYLYDMVYREAAISKILIVAPKNVAKLTWPDEIEKWQEVSDFRYSAIYGTPKQRDAALSKDADMYFIGVDNLDWLLDKYIYQPRSKTGVTKYPWQGSIPFDAIVIDESSLFKNWGSGRYKKLSRALTLSNVPYRILLSGTPSPNGEKDLFAQIKLLDDGERLGSEVGPYLTKYFDMKGNGMIIYEYRLKPGAKKEIARKISDIVLSGQAKDFDIALPELVIDDIELTLDDFDRETYDTLAREFVLDFLDASSVTVKTPADLINKLLQISTGAIYEDAEEGKARVWHELNTLKMDALEALVNKYKAENFLVVYQFRHELDRILERFPHAVALPKGAKIKQVFRDWNEGKIKMLVIHPASAGHGLNLQFGGRRMVWTSPTWNLEHWLQTLARLRRRGGFSKVIAHRLLVKGTEDMRVKRRVLGKEKDQDFLMSEIKHYKNLYNG